MPGTENPNLPTYGLSEAAVEERQPEVPNASFEGGGNEAASNSPGIGINTGDYDPKPSDWSRDERSPQTFQHIGGINPDDIRVMASPDTAPASFVQASEAVGPGEIVPGTGITNMTGKTIPSGSWLWGSGMAGLEPPTGFDRAPPFNIYRLGHQQYATDFNPDNYIIPTEVTYYLSPTGNDSNDGLTPESPKKSVGALVTTLNATPEIAKTLILAPGWYVGSDSLDNVSFAFDHNLICEGGDAIMAYLLTPSWSKTAGRTNIWQTGGIGSAQGLAVIDLSNPDSSDTPTRLKQVSGQETLDVTPNAIATGSTTLYVHTFDGRAPDADILIMGAAKRLWTQEENVNLFHKGIRYFGGSSPVVINGTQAGMTHVFSGCGFNYSKESANGFEIVGSKDETYTLIMHVTSARYNRLDGLNYNGSCLVIEIECPCAWNGYTYDNANDNGSTAHSFVSIIRINGEYPYNSDRNVHDVNSSRSWNIGCKAGFAQNGDPDPYANFNFGSGSSGSSDSPRAWYEGCTSLGGSAGDLTAAGAAIVNTLECVGFDVITTLDSATVTDADPAAWPGRGL